MRLMMVVMMMVMVLLYPMLLLVVGLAGSEHLVGCRKSICCHLEKLFVP
jgi:hypothetical protein